MTTIPIVEKITKANDRIAVFNRQRMDQERIFAVNIMASPGAGKTSLLEITVPALSDRFRMAVIEGDQATNLDADRIDAVGALTVQVNTGGGCHLDASMVSQALDQLPLGDLDLIIVENVGNLICPASFALGTHASVLIASVPEGDDKPFKYPNMYRGVETLVVNKIDLLPHVDFDMDRFRRGVESLNEGVTSFPLSCRTREGVDAWVNWLAGSAQQRIGG